MMSYELAKKLKEVGFPHHWCSEDDCSCLTSSGSSDYCFPSLSKLIEACGEGFGYVTRMPGGIFTAYPSPDKLKERKEWYLCRGTPEEAVANLYLALNQK